MPIPGERMSLPRSNVRVLSNVSVRLPDTDARDDFSFKRAVRTREAIIALHPLIKTMYGIDWELARAVLSTPQLEVLQHHFACNQCGRFDRWPVGASERWRLSRTPLGCLCSPERATARSTQ
jgi:hypothetical protein